jgi:hypothetical protein
MCPMNDFRREILERDIRARSAVRLAFRALACNTAQESPPAQTPMFESAPRRTTPACDHVGTGRDEQCDLTGRTVILCSRCGCSPVLTSFDGDGFAVEVARLTDGRYSVLIRDESGATLPAAIEHREAIAIAVARKLTRPAV